MANLELGNTVVTRRMKYLSTLLSCHWKLWRRHYLLDLRESHKLVWKRKGGTFEISVGDVGIIHEEKQLNSNWHLVKVAEIICGKGRHIRGASLRVITRERRHSIIERTLQKLFSMEIATYETLEPEEGKVSGMNCCETKDRPVEPDRLVRPSRTRRFAAANATK